MKVSYVRNADHLGDGIAVVAFGIWPFKSMALYRKKSGGQWRNAITDYTARIDVVEAIEAALKKQALGK